MLLGDKIFGFQARMAVVEGNCVGLKEGVSIAVGFSEGVVVEGEELDGCEAEGLNDCILLGESVGLVSR
jgi:hypothetical protein